MVSLRQFYQCATQTDKWTDTHTDISAVAIPALAFLYMQALVLLQQRCQYVCPSICLSVCHTPVLLSK